MGSSEDMDLAKLEVAARAYFLAVEQKAGQVVLRTNAGATFSFLADGEWWQFAKLLFKQEELGGIDGERRVLDAAMRVNARHLGCRFAMNEDGALICVAEGHPWLPPDARMEALVRAVVQAEQVSVCLAGVFLALVKGPVDSIEEQLDIAFESQGGAALVLDPE
jgi:hypothetical protein